jgi:hypothetical protein
MRGMPDSPVSSENILQFLRPYPYQVKDDQPPAKCPPWYETIGNSYHCTGHSAGHGVFLLVSPESTLSVAGSINGDIESLARAIFFSTNYVECSNVLAKVALHEGAGWRLCTDARRLCGVYAAHGSELVIRYDGSQLLLSGKVPSYVPVSECKDVPLLLNQQKKFVARLEDGNRVRRVFVTFVCLCLEEEPRWMRFGQQLFKRVRC